MSVKVIIEHGIPIPPAIPRKPRVVIDGLRSTMGRMEVGDSFVIPEKHRAAAKSASNRTKTKLRIVPIEGEIDLLRVWKIGMK